jgi:hypothetical protein
MLVDEGMQDLVITVCLRNLPVHRGNRGAVTSVLEKAGYQVKQVEDGPLDLVAGGVVWIMGNANWFPVVCRQLASKPRPERPLVVLWHAEPLPPPKTTELPWPRLHLRELVKILLCDARATDVYTNYFRLRRLAQQGLPDLLVVSTPGGREFLAEHGIAAHWVPLGYTSFDGHDMGLPRDIDVLFLGALEIPRRKRLIKRLRQRGVNLLAMGSWFDPACWGENRTRLLNRTKIFLNVQRYSGNLSGSRLILGMANKALVISEPMYNPAPYVPGKHYISATIEEMPEVISYYLAHDDERERIVNESHRLVTQEVTMARSVSRILELIREHIN